MKKILLSMCAIVATAVAAAQTLPDVKVENAEGKTISTKSLTGKKPLIISFWSLACKPCMQELNAINDALEEWRDEADFDVVAVSVDNVRLKAPAKAKAEASDWDFICIYDENQDFKRALNVSLTPNSFVVDAEGKIVFSHTGYTPGSEQLLFEKVKELNKGGTKR